MKCFRSFFALVLSLAFFTTAVVPQGAQASTFEKYEANFSLNDVFNKFQYRMTVEWDQKDEAFKNEAKKELEQSLLKLKAEGVSDAQILSYVQGNMMDAKTKKDYDSLLSALAKQGATPAESSAAAMKFMEKNYQQGTHFNGGGTRGHNWVTVLVGVVIVGVVTHLIFSHHGHHNH